MVKDNEVPVLDGWLTATQAANILGLSRQTINKMIKRGAFDTLRRLGDERPIYVVERAEVEQIASERARADHGV